MVEKKLSKWLKKAATSRVEATAIRDTEIARAKKVAAEKRAAVQITYDQTVSRAKEITDAGRMEAT